MTQHTIIIYEPEEPGDLDAALDLLAQILYDKIKNGHAILEPTQQQKAV